MALSPVALLAIAMQLIVLHRIDGGEVAVNPRNITSLHAPKPDGQNKLLTRGAQCAVGLSDGKIVSVVESCTTVRQLLEKPGQ